ncbi:MAG TPA: PqqD family protein [Anaerolineae bacterium]|nr:PqqD family protein [Anaerolineae bacterium]
MNNPQLVANLIWRETDDGIVVVDPTEGNVRVLNGVGSEVWKLVSQQWDTQKIQQRIAENYHISAEQAEADVKAFLTQLSERNMIIWN